MGHFASGQRPESFLVSQLEGCYWYLVHRGPGAVEHPTIHKTAPTTKNYLAQNISNAKDEELCVPKAVQDQ